REMCDTKKVLDYCNLLSKYYYYNVSDGTKEDIDNAIDYTKKMCELGNTYSCYDVLVMQIKHKNDYTGADEFFKKTPDFATNIAYSFESGEMDGIINHENAIKYYKIACENGKNTFACHKLARYYLNGDFLPKDEKKAVQYMENSCVNGYEDCYEIASFYEKGVHVKKDINKAKELYEKGCKNFNDNSCYKAGFLNLYAKDVKPNYEIAKKSFEIGCYELHETSSCNELVNIYTNGLGVKKDLKKVMFLKDGIKKLKPSNSLYM
ncbi:MAG: tetratricopeptide repeat protein, partial [Campylobacteraceae bacterium]